ncbi:hypothetical protein [uncultured Methanobrevibacter sp.]|uniref:hypothetical protein n=1 Tax=uncultured Methanobrevibacter sp. TaxID=253161 RepID=UPI0025F4CE26|nr:hypothetical protein [uncultured Methanobrevibacter sp.]
MKKVLMIFAVLLAVCLTVCAVSADDSWSFNFSSSDSSNSNGGSMSFENGKLKLQDLEFTIPDGFEENQSAQKLAEDATDVKDAKFSVCQFIKDGKEIFVKVFFFDNDEFTAVTPIDNEVNKTMAGIDGVYDANKYNDSTPTFRFVKDGKLVEINAPDDETIESIIKH